jgi:preprotein translocase subunit SecG
MIQILLAVHVLIALSLIGIVLIQKSEGGGLGIGGSSSGMSGFMTGRSQANLLTRTTSILAVCFMLSSVTLAILYARSHGIQPSLLDRLPPQTMPQPQETGAAPAPATPAPAATTAPAAPAKPAVPDAK